MDEKIANFNELHDFIQQPQLGLPHVREGIESTSSLTFFAIRQTPVLQFRLDRFLAL
jgi:hypothetical protein